MILFFNASLSSSVRDYIPMFFFFHFGALCFFQAFLPAATDLFAPTGLINTVFFLLLSVALSPPKEGAERYKGFFFTS